MCFFLITKAISRSGHTGQIKCALLILLLSESSRLTGELLFSFPFAFASLSSPARCGGRGPATLSSSCRRLVTPRRPSCARPQSRPCTRTCAALRSHPTESSGRLGTAPRAPGPVRSPSRFLGATLGRPLSPAPRSPTGPARRVFFSNLQMSCFSFLAPAFLLVLFCSFWFSAETRRSHFRTTPLSRPPAPRCVRQTPSFRPRALAFPHASLGFTPAHCPTTTPFAGRASIFASSLFEVVRFSRTRRRPCAFWNQLAKLPRKGSGPLPTKRELR